MAIDVRDVSVEELYRNSSTEYYWDCIGWKNK